jgi:protein O-mannosyl-transferase
LRQLVDAACRNPARVFLCLTLLAIAGYANVIQGPLFFDDEHFIVKNQAVKDFDLPRIYTSSVTQGALVGGNFYRPNQQVVFATLYQLFGLRSAAYHLASLLLHVTNSFLVYLFLTRLSFGRIGSLFAAALFLIHPVQTEAVSYISGLADPLSLLFILVALYSFSGSLQTSNSSLRWSRISLSSLCTVMALLAKENAVVVFPLAMLIAGYTATRGGWSAETIKRSVQSLLGIGIPVVVYLCLRFTVLRFTESFGLTEERNIYTDNLHVRLITFVNVLFDYARVIIFPKDLFYEKPYTAYLDLVSWRALVGVVWLLLWGYSTVRFRSHRNLAFGLGWFFLSMLPFTGVVPLNAMYLEHWLYVPLIGVCALVASTYDRLVNLKTRDWLLLIGIAVLLLCTVRTNARNTQWADIEKFYLNELKYASASVRMLNNLGMYYAERGHYDKAIEVYGRSIAASDSLPHPHHNLANIYFRSGRQEEAVEELFRALRLDPSFVYSLNLLHEIYQKDGQVELAQRVERLREKIGRGSMPSREDIEAVSAPTAADR